MDREDGLNYSPWVSVFNLCNAVVGAGVLSFPFAFRQTGIFGGPFYSGLIWLVEVGALCILIRVSETYKSKSYQELVISTLGARMAVVTSATILLFVLGAMISFLIITGDVFQPVFAGCFGMDSILADHRLVIALFALVVVLPLSLKRSLQELKWSSTISVIMLTYLTVALSTLGLAHLVDEGFPQHVNFFSGGIHAFIAMDIVVFAFHSHIQVVPIFAELADNPWPFIGDGRLPLEERLLPVPEGLIIEKAHSRRRSTKVKRMDGVILISMTICFVGYCLVGEFGYLLFPNVESDVLKSFGQSNSFMNFARIGMAVVALVCYPVQNHPARSILEDAVKHLFPATMQGFSWTRHMLLTLLIFISTLTTALVISDLGTIFSIVGSTGGVMVIFIIPGLLLIYQAFGRDHLHSHLDSEANLSEDKSKHKTELLKWGRLLAGGCFVGCGALIFVVTTYITAEGLAKHGAL